MAKATPARAFASYLAAAILCFDTSLPTCDSCEEATIATWKGPELWSPDSTANRRQAIICGANTVLFAIVEFLIIRNINTDQPYAWFTREDATVFAYCLGFFIALLALIVVLMLMHERDLRRVIAGDIRIAPRAAIQPNPALALRPGETLALTRTLRPASYWWRLIGMLCLA